MKQTLPNNHEKYKRDDEELHKLWRTPTLLFIHNSVVSLLGKKYLNRKKNTRGLMLDEGTH